MKRLSDTRIIVTVEVEKLKNWSRKVLRGRLQNEVIRGRKGTHILENIKAIIIKM